MTRTRKGPKRLLAIVTLLVVVAFAPMAYAGIATSPLGLRTPTAVAGLGSCPLGVRITP